MERANGIFFVNHQYRQKRLISTPFPGSVQAIRCHSRRHETVLLNSQHWHQLPGSIRNSEANAASLSHIISLRIISFINSVHSRSSTPHRYFEIDRSRARVCTHRVYSLYRFIFPLRHPGSVSFQSVQLQCRKTSQSLSSQKRRQNSLGVNETASLGKPLFYSG